MKKWKPPREVKEFLDTAFDDPAFGSAVMRFDDIKTNCEAVERMRAVAYQLIRTAATIDQAADMLDAQE